MSIPTINPVVAGSAHDEAAIKTIIESVGSLADTGNFEALEKLYADEIELDYTSLNGGEVQVVSAQALMSDWASVLPGFDRTRHEISEISIEIDGGTARATAKVVADHYVKELFWQVSGQYQYRLKKGERGWVISAHRFTLAGEQGARDVFVPASQTAALNPAPYILRQKTEEAVRTFLESLETKDMAMFASAWADEAVQDMPYAPEGFPRRVNGKANILTHYADWPKNSGLADFTSQLVFYPMQNPQMVFAELVM